MMSHQFEEFFRDGDFSDEPQRITALRRMITASNNLHSVFNSWRKWVNTLVDKSAAKDNTVKRYLYGLDPEPNIWTIILCMTRGYQGVLEAID